MKIDLEQVCIYWAYDKLGKKSGAKLKMVVKLKK